MSAPDFDFVIERDEAPDEFWLDLHFDGWRECPSGPCMACEKGAP